MLDFKRAWTVAVDGQPHVIEVEYAALFGWMSIHVDGVRVARGWREWQTVVGGANLACEYQGRQIHARVTQPFGRQEYSFSLRVDGVLQPGSDPQPEPRSVTRYTLRALGWIAVIVFIVTVATQVASRLS